MGSFLLTYYLKHVGLKFNLHFYTKLVLILGDIRGTILVKFLLKRDSMSLTLKELEIPGYEKVVEVKDDSCGMHGIISIHDTTMGPALGGIRFYPYANFDAALIDVLRLSQGMTYKAIMADVGLGGGKSVMIVDSTKKTEEQLRSFAKAINILEGEYIGAPDYGCTPKDMLEIRSTTRYVVAVPHTKSSGDPSGFTAFGTIVGLRASLKKVFGDESFKGKTFAIQGLGSVGLKIAETIFWEGGNLIVADPNEEKTKYAASRLGATVVASDEIMKVACDVFVPCALGAILNENTIPHLKCKAVAGCANNQLHKDTDALLLKEKGILYAPDFVINAGGLINVTFELDEKGYDPRLARAKICQIYDTLLAIYAKAEEENITTQKAVLLLAEHKLANKLGKREKELYFHEMAEIC